MCIAQGHSCLPPPGQHQVWSEENKLSWEKFESNTARVRKCLMTTRAYRVRGRVIIWGEKEIDAAGEHPRYQNA